MPLAVQNAEHSEHHRQTMSLPARLRPLPVIRPPPPLNRHHSPQRDGSHSSGAQAGHPTLLAALVGSPRNNRQLTMPGNSVSFQNNPHIANNPNSPHNVDHLPPGLSRILHMAAPLPSNGLSSPRASNPGNLQLRIPPLPIDVSPRQGLPRLLHALEGGPGSPRLSALQALEAGGGASPRGSFHGGALSNSSVGLLDSAGISPIGAAGLLSPEASGTSLHVSISGAAKSPRTPRGARSLAGGVTLLEPLPSPRLPADGPTAVDFDPK